MCVYKYLNTEIERKTNKIDSQNVVYHMHNANIRKIEERLEKMTGSGFVALQTTFYTWHITSCRIDFDHV